MARPIQQPQRQLIACALKVLADADFALAGSGAIREHGLPTRSAQPSLPTAPSPIPGHPQHGRGPTL